MPETAKFVLGCLGFRQYLLHDALYRTQLPRNVQNLKPDMRIVCHPFLNPHIFLV
jgi:hypothetical protein